MFKPFEIFYEKKVKKLNDPEEKLDKKQVDSEWANLKEKKLKKFIKKAEKKYDAYVEENANDPSKQQPPFSTFLTKKELKILLKSYGLPEKPAFNTKIYFINKYAEEEAKKNDETDDTKYKKEGEVKWKSMSDDEKEKLTQEFQKESSLFFQLYFEFARNLPEKRAVDYQLSLTNSAAEPKEKKVVEKKSKEKKEKDETKEHCRHYIPHEIYYDKYKEEHPDSKPFQIRNESRKAFTELNDKKKLKLIKQAESNYDSTTPVPDKLFSSFLNKKELKLLFDSYGMPENVPNLSAYYFKKHKGDFSGPNNELMKKVFEKFRGLDEKSKNALLSEHTKELEKFTILNKEFQEKLPLSRLADYKFYKTKYGPAEVSPKKSKKANKSVAKSSSDAKIVSNDEEEESENETATKKEENEEIELSDDEDEPQKDKPFSKENSLDRSSVNEISMDKKRTLHLKSDINNSPIKINKEKDINTFISKSAKRAENPFSLYVKEELKWNVLGSMTKEESQAFLSKLGLKWFYLKPNERKNFEEKFNESKKSYKKSVKEFIINNSIKNMDFNEMINRIDKTAKKESKEIKFIFSELEEEVAFINDNLSLIHDSISYIDLTSKLENGVEKNGKSDSSSDDSEEEKNTPSKRKATATSAKNVKKFLKS